MMYSYLAAGDYAFFVRAIDAAGNTDTTPATWAFALTTPVSEQFTAGTPVSGSSTTLALPGSRAPVAPKLGVFSFATPSRPVRLHRGTTRLHFRCSDPDGCSPATFVISPARRARRPAFTVTVKVMAAASGDHAIAVRFGPAARRALRRAGRRGMRVRMTRTTKYPSPQFTLVAG
jgi:hypothetical protein